MGVMMNKLFWFLLAVSLFGVTYVFSAQEGAGAAAVSRPSLLDRMEEVEGTADMPFQDAFDAVFEERPKNLADWKPFNLRMHTRLVMAGNLGFGRCGVLICEAYQPGGLLEGKSDIVFPLPEYWVASNHNIHGMRFLLDRNSDAKGKTPQAFIDGMMQDVLDNDGAGQKDAIKFLIKRNAWRGREREDSRIGDAWEEVYAQWDHSIKRSRHRLIGMPRRRFARR